MRAVRRGPGHVDAVRRAQRLGDVVDHAGRVCELLHGREAGQLLARVWEYVFSIDSQKAYRNLEEWMLTGSLTVAVSPSARAKAAAAQPAATSAPQSSSSTAPMSTTAAPFTSAGFAPPVGATPSINRRRGRPSVPAAQSQAPSGSLSNQDFESLKRQYNRMSTSELDKLAEQSAAERARISLQLAAIDAVRAAREAFASRPSNGTTHPA